MSKKIISTTNAPQALGPYSQANIIECKKLIFCSGQVPIDPATGKVIDGDIKAQTRQVLNNVKAVLEAGGTRLDKVLKTTVFLKNMDDFQAMNEVYAEFFADNYPARAAVQVAKLPLDVDVEIEAIAYID